MGRDVQATPVELALADFHERLVAEPAELTMDVEELELRRALGLRSGGG